MQLLKLINLRLSKNICIVSPSLKMGGIERALSVLANNFIKKGHQVSFISAQGGVKFYKLDEKITFYEPNFTRKKGIIGKITAYSTIIKFIRKTVTKIKPDVVLSFGDVFNPLVLYALKSTKIPVYISDRTSPDFKFNKIVQLGKKYLYPKSAGFIAQTKRASDYKEKKFNGKLNIKIIPNAIKDIVLYDAPKTNTILSVGRLSHEKGHDRLIKAFAQIAKHNLDWKLVVAGSGPKMEEYKSMTDKLAIKNQVTFLGTVTNVDELLSQASIFVLPSRLEGFPNALCEAMVAGVPCICFDSIPTEAILEDNKDGIVVKEADIEGLAQKLSFLINNPNERKRLGNNAKQIRGKLNLEYITNEYLSFILD